MPYKLGKRPARKGAVRFHFSTFFDISNLPTPPATFGTYDKFDGWGLFSNDQYGDCVWAGAANETMDWGHERGNVVSFTDDTVLSDYAAVTGFDKSNPETDQGTDMATAAGYRRKTGLVDVHGVRHRVDSYVSLKLGDIDQLKVAMYLFGGVGIGIEFPSSAMDLFDQGRPWTVKRNDEIEGGHYIPAFGINPKGNIMVVTWGRVQEMTPSFYKKYADEVCAYLDISRLKDNLSPEGFKYDILKQHLSEIKSPGGYSG